MSNSSSGRPKPLRLEALRSFIHKALEDGYFRESYHSEVERSSRNISIQDIVYGLQRDDWLMVGSPAFDEKHQEWKYTIKTVDLESEELHLRIAVSVERFSFTVVTKW